MAKKTTVPPASPNPFMSKIEVRPCASLGTQWRDVWVDGRPWAIQVPTAAAKAFAGDPGFFGVVWDDQMLRGRMIEQMHKTMRPEGVLRLRG